MAWLHVHCTFAVPHSNVCRGNKDKSFLKDRKLELNTNPMNIKDEWQSRLYNALPYPYSCGCWKIEKFMSTGQEELEFTQQYHVLCVLQALPYLILTILSFRKSSSQFTDE